MTLAPAATPSSVVFGNPVTISAHLSSPDTTAVPTGSVIVESGGVVSVVPVDASGDITFTTSALPAGTDSVLVAYQGDATFANASTTVDVTVTDASTSTVVQVTPVGPTALGATVTLDAQVTASGTPTTPGGAVELFDGTTSLGLAALDATGAATFPTSALGLGAHQLTAVFRPDPGFAASTSSAVAHTVTAVATTTPHVPNRREATTPVRAACTVWHASATR